MSVEENELERSDGTTRAPTLGEWRARLSGSDTCPWPGPRPLTADDPIDLLEGRAGDCVRFRQAVDTHKLVFLSGTTGVGKSSLLLCGLIPELEENGYVVASCRDWSGTDEVASPAEFLTLRIRPGLVGALAKAEEKGVVLPAVDLPEDISLFANVNSSLGGRVVLVLDQFEELIRDAPQFKVELFKALVHLNRNTEIKIIVSLRSEYLHELRPLERRVNAFSVTSYHLEQIADADAVKVIQSANALGEVPESAITATAAKTLADDWQEARANPTVDGLEVGLLHLQGILFALHSRAGGKVTDETYSAFLGEMGLQGAPKDEVMLAGLHSAIDTKVDRCKEVAEAMRLDPYLVEGAAQIVSRMVPHLASAGYKLVREAAELADTVLEDELTSLRRGARLAASGPARGDDPDGPLQAGEFASLFRIFMRSLLSDSSADVGQGDLDLFADRRSIAEAADDSAGSSSRWVRRLHEPADGEEPPSPTVIDPLEVTSGPMLGMAPAAAMVEELRRYAFALEWLQASDLVRLSTPKVDVVMVALVHDGFGRALELWSASDVVSKCGEIYGLTAPLGAEFDWKSDPDDPTILEDFDGTKAEGRPVRILPNLRWRGAWISANFRGVMFVNCDLRGSQFAFCRMEGVTLVNCLLDGLMFSDCTIVGSTEAMVEQQGLDDAGVFEIDDVDDVVAILGHYQNRELDGEVLLSGVPQTRAEPSVHVEGRRQLPLHQGGVQIYGGRASSLLIRRCNFDQDGCFALRETAGSGVDIVEHLHAGRYEVTDSRLRHVTLSSSPTLEGGGDPIDVVVRRSVLLQIWTGADLEGRLRVVDSVLVQAWNGAPGLEASLELGPAGETSRYFGLVGFTVGPEHEALLPGDLSRSLVEVDPEGFIVERALGMDYRRHASEPEVPLPASLRRVE